MTEIARHLARVRERIAAAALRAGRSAESIALVAVTKTIPPERITEAYAAGIRDFGENYVQEALAKYAQLPFQDMRLHFIGHLQRNKVKEVEGRFSLIQSVDSLLLAQEIGKRARHTGRIQEILLEVKLDPADAKFGIRPEQTLETVAAVQAIPDLRCLGLMGMAPYTDTPEAARPAFRQLAALFTQLPAPCRQTLSMGMSGDFEIAIEEGSTMVRIGTALFGRRS